MTNYFYFDQANQKRGPVSEQQLKQLAAQGIIGLHTPMETDTGHKGVAGQIPGLFSTTAQPVQPPSVDLFCTNCGNAVSTQSVGCMSCGLKPSGHKKFCRHCGAERKPEHVDHIICIKCGASFADGYAKVIGGARQAAESVMSSSKLGNVKKVAIRVIAVAVAAGLIWFVGGLISNFFAGDSVYLNQLRRASVGDWVEYESTLSLGGDVGKMRTRFEVLATDRNRIRLEVTIRSWGRSWLDDDWGPAVSTEIEIDLTARSDEQLIRSMIKEAMRQQGAPPRDRDFVDRANFDFTRSRMRGETLQVAGQDVRCTVTSLTASISVDNLSGSIGGIREWSSSRVPFGLVQMELRMDVPDFDLGGDGTFIATVRLIGFRR